MSSRTGVAVGVIAGVIGGSFSVALARTSVPPPAASANKAGCTITVSAPRVSGAGTRRFVIAQGFFRCTTRHTNATVSVEIGTFFAGGWLKGVATRTLTLPANRTFGFAGHGICQPGPPRQYRSAARLTFTSHGRRMHITTPYVVKTLGC
jgi:hypothetical protein